MSVSSDTAFTSELAAITVIGFDTGECGKLFLFQLNKLRLFIRQRVYNSSANTRHAEHNRPF